MLNSEVDTPRSSKDLHLFHDVEFRVVTSAETDAATLRPEGCPVESLLRQPWFQRAARHNLAGAGRQFENSFLNE